MIPMQAAGAVSLHGKMSNVRQLRQVQHRQVHHQNQHTRLLLIHLRIRQLGAAEQLKMMMRMLGRMKDLDPLLDVEGEVEEVVDDRVRGLQVQVRMLPRQGHPRKLRIHHANRRLVESQYDRLTQITITLQGKRRLLALDPEQRRHRRRQV
jgi:hypothetical protein